jgi:hypothetical protein
MSKTKPYLTIAGCAGCLLACAAADTPSANAGTINDWTPVINSLAGAITTLASACAGALLWHIGRTNSKNEKENENVNQK